MALKRLQTATLAVALMLGGPASALAQADASSTPSAPAANTTGRVLGMGAPPPAPAPPASAAPAAAPATPAAKPSPSNLKKPPPRRPDRHHRRPPA
jgi:rod shape-determining protein MreC